MRVVRRIGLLVVSLCIVAGTVRGAPYLAPIRARDIQQHGQAIEFVDRYGLALGTLLTRDQEHAVAVPLQAISPRFTQAIIAAEDGRYWSHGPVDYVALARAAWQALSARRVVSGASTITMQLARMVRPSPSTLGGKLAQIWTAWRLGAGMDRGEILAAYVNRVPMGGNVYGVEAAARTYLGLPAVSLDLAQASLLAAIPNDPTGLLPYGHWQALKARQRYVLERMRRDGLISADQAARAAAEEIALQPPGQGIVAAPHFLFWLAGRLPDGTAKVRTTIDRDLQRFVEGQVRQVLSGLRSRDVRDAAAIVIDNRTRQVLAYVGSPDYFSTSEQGRNDGVQALRQPGSALKPFLYEEALEERTIQPNTILADAPVHYALPDGLLYSPVDYNDTFLGPVRVRIALADSLNIPAVRVLSRLGVSRFLDRLHALGFTHLAQPADYYGLGLTLGGGEVSLWELARAYVTLAHGGQASELVSALGTQVSGDAATLQDPVGDATAWALIADMLADPHARATAFGVGSVLDLPFPAAVKTGTSSDFRDTWTVGFTSDYTVGVWVGNFNGEPMRHVSGVSGAAPLWNRIMLHLHDRKDPQPLAAPLGLLLEPICSTTGLRPRPECPAVVYEYLYPQDMREYGAPPPADLPPEYDEWLARQDRPAAVERVKILFPRTGDVFAWFPGPSAFDSIPQALRFELSLPHGWKARWSLNGVPLPGDQDHAAVWALRPGRWTIAAASHGRSDSVTFAVVKGVPRSLPHGFSLPAGNAATAGAPHAR